MRRAAVAVLALTTGAPAATADPRPIPDAEYFGIILLPLVQAGSCVEDVATIRATGRLIVEPYLWVSEGALRPLVPDGVRLWTALGLARVRAEGHVELVAFPSTTMPTMSCTSRAS